MYIYDLSERALISWVVTETSIDVALLLVVNHSPSGAYADRSSDVQYVLLLVNGPVTAFLIRDALVNVHSSVATVVPV